MKDTIETGDRVRAKEDIAHIEAGDKFRVEGVSVQGDEITLAGEEGTWSASRFEVYSKAKSDAPVMPEASEQGEALTVTVVLNHVTDSVLPRGETLANLQLSTLKAHGVLANQIGYFFGKGEGENLFVSPEHLRTIMAGMTADILYVYTPSPRLTHIIMDMAVFEAFMEKGGHTIMGGIAAAVQEAGIMTENFGHAGRDTTLMAFIPDTVEQEPDLDTLAHEDRGFGGRDRD